MSQIVNSNPMSLILTNYGLQRITNAMADPKLDLNLTKVKLGTGKNNDFYEPIETQTDLEGPITGGEFFILEKALLEDETTVSFKFLVSESFGGYDIREVGLYETIDDEDYLFAIGVQQPLTKPSIDYDYYITIDYSIFLKSANLASVYDQIVLSTDNQLVTEENLEDLMSVILFTEGSMLKQVNDTSKIIGLNRSSQIYKEIKEAKEEYSYLTIYESYANLISAIGLEKIFAYWVFNYPRRVGKIGAITDIASNKYNLTANQNINLFDRSYAGVTALLNFTEDDYFFLDSSVDLPLVDTNLSKDKSFSIGFIVYPNEYDTKKTLLARSNYATKVHMFEINETENNELEVVLFADSKNYVTFKSDVDTIPNSVHSIVLSYNAVLGTVTAFISGAEVNMTKTTTGTYKCMNTSNLMLQCYYCIPYEVIYSKKNVEPMISSDILNTDGSPYDGINWFVDNNGNLLYQDHSTVYDSSKDSSTVPLYAWNYDDGVEKEYIYTKGEVVTETTILYNADYTEYTGTNFVVVQSGSSYIIQYRSGSSYYEVLRDSEKDIASTILYAWRYDDEPKRIWANGGYNSSLFTTSGLPTITSTGFISNMSSSNYVITGGLSTTNNIELTCAFSCPETVTDENIITFVGTENTVKVLVSSTGRIKVTCTQGGVTKEIIDHLMTDTTFEETTYIRICDVDGVWTLYTSNDGLNYTYAITASDTYDLVEDFGIFNIGNGITSTATTIDLKQLLLSVDGIQVFKGRNANDTLFDANADLYLEDDWGIGSNDLPVYLQKHSGIYDPERDITVPNPLVASYVTDKDSNKAYPLNSRIGIITVALTYMSSTFLRVIALNLEAIIGNNPCITTW